MKNNRKNVCSYDGVDDSAESMEHDYDGCAASQWHPNMWKSSSYSVNRELLS